MKVSVTETSEIKRKLEVTLPSEQVAGILDEVYLSIQQKARIKGFRPGKAPRSVLEQFYRADAEEETIKNLVGRSYPEAIQEAGILPVSKPEVEIRGFEVGKDFTYEAVVEVRPAIDVKGYRGMKLNKEKIVVTEAEVGERLERLRERVAQLVPLAEARPCRQGDIVVVDYQGYEGGKVLSGVAAKDTRMELGRGTFLPDFESGVVGMSTGEKKKVGVTFPPDAADKKFAGKRVTYEVHLKEIREKSVPSLNDDFAKDLGKFQTLDEVRAEIRRQIEQSREQEVRNKLRQEIIELLVKENKFSVPEGLVELELEQGLGRLQASLRSQGVTLEEVGLTAQDFFAKNRGQAALAVQGDLLFEAIADKEGITITDEMVEQRVSQMAGQSAGSPEAWMRSYREKKQLPVVKMALRGEKTLDFVLAEAKIKTKE